MCTIDRQIQLWQRHRQHVQFVECAISAKRATSAKCVTSAKCATSAKCVTSVPSITAVKRHHFIRGVTL